jgi:hypothetical protein
VVRELTGSAETAGDRHHPPELGPSHFHLRFDGRARATFTKKIRARLSSIGSSRMVRPPPEQRGWTGASDHSGPPARPARISRGRDRVVVAHTFFEQAGVTGTPSRPLSVTSPSR